MKITAKDMKRGHDEVTEKEVENKTDEIIKCIEMKLEYLLKNNLTDNSLVHELDLLNDIINPQTHEKIIKNLITRLKKEGNFQVQYFRKTYGAFHEPMDYGQPERLVIKW